MAGQKWTYGAGAAGAATHLDVLVSQLLPEAQDPVTVGAAARMGPDLSLSRTEKLLIPYSTMCEKLKVPDPCSVEALKTVGLPLK